MTWQKSREGCGGKPDRYQALRELFGGSETSMWQTTPSISIFGGDSRLSLVLGKVQGPVQVAWLSAVTFQGHEVAGSVRFEVVTYLLQQ